MSEDKVPMRPSIMPSKEMMEAANQTNMEIAKQFSEENQVDFSEPVSDAEQKAAEEMARRTQQQIEERNRLMQEQIEKARKLEEEREKMLSDKPPQQPPKPPISNNMDSQPMSNPSPQPKVNKYDSLSQPQLDAPYDVIPIPSGGKVYKNAKSTVRMALMTASDENILSNPNLSQSGEFLEILINRKLLEPNLRYRDLHVGDRNALMIWLRATSFGPEYPIQVIDPKTYEPFEHIVDLSTLKTIPLGAEPDAEGYFDYKMPMSGDIVKFKLLTTGDVEDIEEYKTKIKEELGEEFVEESTYTLKRQIVEVNGDRNPETLKQFINTLRIRDAREFRKYVDSIESGIDLKLEIETPSGETIFPYLPFNTEFFWPSI